MICRYIDPTCCLQFWNPAQGHVARALVVVCCVFAVALVVPGTVCPRGPVRNLAVDSYFGERDVCLWRHQKALIINTNLYWFIIANENTICKIQVSIQGTISELSKQYKRKYHPALHFQKIIRGTTSTSSPWFTHHAILTAPYSCDVITTGVLAAETHLHSRWPA